MPQLPLRGGGGVAVLYLLACLLLWTDLPVWGELDRLDGLAAALWQVGRDEEWVGDVEGQPPTVPCTVAKLRELRDELREAPHLWVVRHLPDEDFCGWQVRFNEEHGRWLDVQRTLVWAHERAEIDDWIWENSRRWNVWVCARVAATPGHTVGYRRTCLRRLADQIGEDALEAGALPDPVPTWRFRRLP